LYLTRRSVKRIVRDYLGSRSRPAGTSTRSWRLAGLAIDNGALHKQRELARLFQIAADARPKYLLEVGLSVAGTFATWSKVCPSARLIVGLDLVKPQRVPRSVAADPRFTIVVGDSHSEGTVDRVRECLPEGVDFLFIDGDHSYAGVKMDFTYFSKMVNPGGIIALHDINRDSFVKSGVRKEADSGGVYKFWQEIRRSYACEEIVEDLEQDGYGIGVVRWT
jgi:Methyltransferase domain